MNSEEQRDLYNALAQYLMTFFANDFYDTKEQLQQDFETFKATDYYNTALLAFANSYCPEEELVVADFRRLTASRWKLCTVCGRGFLSTDNNNRSLICDWELYKRYKIGKGGFFKGTTKGTSQCTMLYRANWQKERQNLYETLK